MIAYICNHCKKPIDLKEKKCVHINITYGERAITSNGKYSNSCDADLCEACFKKILPMIDAMIDEYYYGANTYLKGE